MKDILRMSHKPRTDRQTLAGDETDIMTNFMATLNLRRRRSPADSTSGLRLRLFHFCSAHGRIFFELWRSNAYLKLFQGQEPQSGIVIGFSADPVNTVMD